MVFSIALSFCFFCFGLTMVGGISIGVFSLLLGLCYQYYCVFQFVYSSVLIVLSLYYN